MRKDCESSDPSISRSRVSIEGSSNPRPFLISSQGRLQLCGGGIVEHLSSAIQQPKLVGVGVVGVLQQHSVVEELHLVKPQTLPQLGHKVGQLNVGLRPSDVGVLC